MTNLLYAGFLVTGCIIGIIFSYKVLEGLVAKTIPLFIRENNTLGFFIALFFTMITFICLVAFTTFILSVISGIISPVIIIDQAGINIW